MTTEQIARQADLIRFFLHDDREPFEVDAPAGPYGPGERAVVHTLHTELTTDTTAERGVEKTATPVFV